MSASEMPVAMITGSGRRRVGNVVARSLAERGYAIAIHYHTAAEAAQETVQSIRVAGGIAEAYRADISDESQVDAMFDAVFNRFQRLDVLVTTASTWDSASLEDTRAEDLLRSFSVNTLGTFLCARRAGLAMAQQPDGGTIVTIGDWAVQRPYLNHAAYFVSKGAIPTMTRTLAVELATRNPRVRVNCIMPGPVMFPPEATEQERQELAESTLLQTGDCPESISRTVLFFIENDFVTGVCLPVDGGRSIFAGEATRRDRPI